MVDAHSQKRPTAGALALSALGGVALAGAVPPLELTAGVWIAIALLCAALDGLVREERAALWGALCGALFGFVTHALGIACFRVVFERFGELAPPWASGLAVLLWLTEALPYAAAGGLTAWLARRVARPAGAEFATWWLLPLLLTASCALVPQLFPWQPSALAVPWLWVVQCAELGGASLVTLCIAMTATSAYALVRQRRLARAPLIALALSLGVPLGYGALRLAQLRSERARAEPLRLGVVQPNASVAEMRHDEGRRRVLARLREETRTLERAELQATLWAESAYPFPLARARQVQPLDAPIVGDGVRGPVLFGALSYAWAGDEKREYNSAFLVDESGALRGRVDKVRLIPWAEFIPGWDTLPWLRPRFPSRGLEVGERGTLTVGSAQLGVLICYEDLFAGLARAHVRDGARALVNLTNDAWFDGTNGPALHELLARMRSVEMRRDLVRVTNTGVSTHTAFTGERLVATRPAEQTHFIADVRLRSAGSVYARTGDWLPWLCLVACLALAWRKAYSAS